MNPIPFTILAAGALLAATASATTTVLGYNPDDSPITGNPFASVELGGTHTTALWDGVSSADHPGYSGFPGNAPWPRPMSPNSGNSSAVLEKVSNGPGGGPYPSSSSIYHGGQSYGDISGGVLRVYDATPTMDLSTVVFQIQIGDALVWAFHQNQMPTLSYTTASGTVGNLAADHQSYFGFVESPGFESFDIGIRTYGFQWDLSGVEEDITSLWVTINAVQHAQIYGMQLDQGGGVFSESILPASIPEPSGVLLGLGGLIALTVRRRR